jgi:hypothetical protein
MHYYKKLQMGAIEKFKTTPKIEGLSPKRKCTAQNESAKAIILGW